MAERARFHRFIADHIGDAADAGALLQRQVLKALMSGAPFRRDERAIDWFIRVLEDALRDGSFSVDGADWSTAVSTCFRGLLVTLTPRYAELLRRIDLDGEEKREVSRGMNLKSSTLDVALHRARYALRANLEIWCVAETREQCLACLSRRRARR